MLDFDLNELGQESCISLSKPHPFFMVPRKIWEMGLNINAKMVFFVLQDYANKTGVAYEKTAVMIQRAGMCRKTFFVALKQLEALNIISRKFVQKYNRNNYIVHAPEDWAKPISEGECITRTEGGCVPDTQGCVPDTQGGVYHVHSSPTFRERDQIRKINKERHFCAAENPPSQPQIDPPILNSPEPTQTPNQFVQVAESETSKQRGGLEPSREESTQLIPSKNVQMQNNGGLVALKQSRAVSEGNDKQNTTTEVWNAYSQAYGQRYKGPGGIPIQPPRNARTNQVCKKLVDQFGVQVALGLVNFIFYSKDAYIIRNTHSLLAPNDACWQSLYTQMMSGQRMTQTKAVQEDKMGALDDVATRAIERWSKIERERNEKR